MAFANREEAARKLAECLSPYKWKYPLILAIPRGAVPMGKIIADALGGELDVVLVRKLGAPGNPEYAIGSVDESGHVMLNPEAEGIADEEYVKEEVRRQMETMRKRRALYTPVRPPSIQRTVSSSSWMMASRRARRCLRHCVPSARRNRRNSSLPLA